MPETIKRIPFSSSRREIRKLMRGPASQEAAVPTPDFLPCDLLIWIGKDSDSFHRAFCHHRMILKVILAGRAATCIDGVRFELFPSEAVLYFPMQTHSTETAEDGIFEYLAVSFVAGMGRYDALNGLKNRVFSPDPENNLLPDLVRAWKQNRRMTASGLLAELLSRALFRVSGEAACAKGCFGKIAEYIRRHCGGELSVKQIAAEFDISPQSVRRIFQRNMHGLTPGDLIRQQRMVLAAELLRRTELPLSIVAGKCGFATPFSFSRAFRKQYGMPPSLYRRGGTAGNQQMPASFRVS